jgi:hypothetical protein
VIRGLGTDGEELGQSELAVISFKGPGVRDFEVDYGTPVADKVLGCLHDVELEPILERIAQLPSARPAGNAPAPV